MKKMTILMRKAFKTLKRFKIVFKKKLIKILTLLFLTNTSRFKKGFHCSGKSNQILNVIFIIIIIKHTFY